MLIWTCRVIGPLMAIIYVIKIIDDFDYGYFILAIIHVALSFGFWHKNMIK